MRTIDKSMRENANARYTDDVSASLALGHRIFAKGDASTSIAAVRAGVINGMR